MPKALREVITLWKLIKHTKTGEMNINQSISLSGKTRDCGVRRTNWWGKTSSLEILVDGKHRPAMLVESAWTSLSPRNCCTDDSRRPNCGRREEWTVMLTFANCMDGLMRCIDSKSSTMCRLCSSVVVTIVVVITHFPAAAVILVPTTSIRRWCCVQMYREYTRISFISDHLFFLFHTWI